MAQNIPELYGSLVFNDKVMRSKLPKRHVQSIKEKQSRAVHTLNLMLPTPLLLQ